MSQVLLQCLTLSQYGLSAQSDLDPSVFFDKALAQHEGVMAGPVTLLRDVHLIEYLSLGTVRTVVLSRTPAYLYLGTVARHRPKINANSEIQAKYPGAPSLVGWSKEQCSLGGANAQASGNAHEFTFEDCNLGGTNAQATHAANAAVGQPSLNQYTFEDRSRGGANGTGGGNKEGSGVGNHSAPSKAQTQANLVSYQAARPEKLPEEARENGFHYSDLPKLFGMQFMNAADKSKARVSKISMKKK
jgi:hypothetical protein